MLLWTGRLSRGNHVRLLARGTLPVLTLPGTEILLRSHMMQTSIFVDGTSTGTVLQPFKSEKIHVCEIMQ